jgi:hypothetical protein
MDVQSVANARRSWSAARRLASELQHAAGPSAGEVFARGFLRGSLLQLAICTPPREAAMPRYAAVYVTRLAGANKQLTPVA